MFKKLIIGEQVFQTLKNSKSSFSEKEAKTSELPHDESDKLLMLKTKKLWRSRHPRLICDFSAYFVMLDPPALKFCGVPPFGSTLKISRSGDITSLYPINPQNFHRLHTKLSAKNKNNNGGCRS